MNYEASSASRQNQKPLEQVETVGMVPVLDDAWTSITRWKPPVIERWRRPDAIDNKECRARRHAAEPDMPAKTDTVVNVVGDSPPVAHRKQLRAMMKGEKVVQPLPALPSESLCPLNTNWDAILTSAVVPSRKRSCRGSHLSVFCVCSSRSRA